MANPPEKDEARELAKTVGAAIAVRRKSRGLSQEKLAELVNCHRTYVGIVERGERNITVLTLKAFALALECQPSEILRDVRM